MGFAYNRINVLMYGAISMAVAAVLTALFPHMSDLYWLCGLFFFSGLVLGGFEACSNIFLLHIWGRENGPFMQTYDFSFGIGTLLATLVAHPFLLETEDDGDGYEVTGMPTEESAVSKLITTIYPYLVANETESGGEITTTIKSTDGYSTANPDDLMLVYPYSIIAAILAFNSFFMLSLWIFYPQTEEHPSRKKVRNVTSNGVDNKSFEDEDDQENKNGNTLELRESNDNCITINETKGDNERGEQDKKKSHGFYKGVVIILMMMFAHVSYGLELTLGQFLVTFAVDSDLHLSKSQGTRLTSLFWGTFTFWRLTTIFYIEYIGHELNLLASLAIILIGNVFLVPFGNSNELCLWIGVAIIGLGASSMWPSMFGYMEDYFAVSSRVASAIIISATVGDFVFPFIISFFVDSNPQVFLWATLFCSLSLAVIFLGIMAVMRTKLKEGKKARRVQ